MSAILDPLKRDLAQAIYNTKSAKSLGRGLPVAGGMAGAEKQANDIITQVSYALMDQAQSPNISEQQISDFINSTRTRVQVGGISTNAISIDQLKGKLTTLVNENHKRDLDAANQKYGKTKDKDIADANLNQQRTLKKINEAMATFADSAINSLQPTATTPKATAVIGELTASILASKPGTPTAADQRNAEAKAARILDVAIELMMEVGIDTDRATDDAAFFIRNARNKATGHIDMADLEKLFITRVQRTYDKSHAAHPADAATGLNESMRKIGSLNLFTEPTAAVQSPAIHGRVDAPIVDVAYHRV